MFTKLIKTEGKTILFDEVQFNTKCDQLKELQAALSRVQGLLSGAGYKQERAWTEAVAFRGSDGLISSVKEDTEKEIKRIGIPSYLVTSFRHSAIENIPRAILDEADGIYNEIARFSDGLPVNGAIKYKRGQGLFVEEEMVIESIRAACSHEVPDSDKKAGETILAVSKSLRELELAGINALELVEKYVGKKETPEEVELLLDVTRRRHAQGTIFHPDLARVWNETALRNHGIIK